MKFSHLSAALALVITSCQTAKPMFVVKNQASETVIIDYYKFKKTVAVDMNGSNWKILDLKPLRLPYTGKITRLSAEERWLKIYAFAMATIKEDCRGAPAQAPVIRAAELDYKKFGNSANHPAYIQAKYLCH